MPGASEARFGVNNQEDQEDKQSSNGIEVEKNICQEEEVNNDRDNKGDVHRNEREEEDTTESDFMEFGNTRSGNDYEINVMKGSPLLTLPITLKEQQVNAMIDSGASISFIPEKIAMSLKLDIDPSDTIEINGYGNRGFTTRGSVTEIITIDSYQFLQKFLVMPPVSNQQHIETILTKEYINIYIYNLFIYIYNLFILFAK